METPYRVYLVGLRRSRQAAGLSQTAVGNLVNVTKQTISNAERGKPVKPGTAQAIIGAMRNVAPDAPPVGRHDVHPAPLPPIALMPDMAQLRSDAGVSVRRLASLARVSEPLVKAAERGELVDAHAALRLAQVLAGLDRGQSVNARQVNPS
jgi:transcriptional regulator with XRE-family HTH domain